MNLRLLSAFGLCLASATAHADPIKGPSDSQVVFEIRIVTTSADAPLKGPKAEAGGLAILTDDQFKSLLDDSHGDRRTNVLAAPKVTTADGKTTARNGQRREFVTGLDVARVDGRPVLVPRQTAVELGDTLVLRGNASANRSQVTVDLQYTNRLAGGMEPIAVTAKGESTQYLQAPDVRTVEVEKTGLVLPSGGHAVITGPVQEVAEASVVRTPVLSDLPVVGRMFTSTGYRKTSVRTLVVVTARVK